MLGLASTICDLGCVKSLIVAWLAFIGVSLVYAEALKPADREALLDSIEKLHQTAQSNVDSRFQSALVAYREAMGSDESAIEFYLKCTEKLEFDDKDRKEADFREWKKKQDRKISADGFGLALRQQLRWLVLTMRSSSEKSDLETIADEAASIVDSIFGNPQLLKSQSDVLRQSASGTIFARAYEIGSFIKSPLPQSPLDLEAIYEDFILPPIRATGDVAALREAWIKRIRQEGYRNGGGEQTREGSIQKAPRSDAYERFMEEKLPEIQWQMEVDLFRHGDEAEAAKRMCEHIEKHINHPSARKWSEALVGLIKPQEE